MEDEGDKVGDFGDVGFDDDGGGVWVERWWREGRGDGGRRVGVRVEGFVEGVGDVEVVAGEGDGWWGRGGIGLFGGRGCDGDFVGVDDGEAGFVLAERVS